MGTRLALEEIQGNIVPGFNKDHQALLLLGADRAEDLALDLLEQLELLRRCGLRVIRTYRGDALPGEQRGHEHFGFKDGVSQPVVEGTPDACAAAADEPPVPAGEFV